MNCDNCGNTVQFHLGVADKQMRVCSSECASTLIEGSQKKTDEPNLKLYIAFPEAVIPYEFDVFKSRDRTLYQTTVVEKLKHSFPVYTGQSIDYNTSLIVVFVFSPISVLGSETMNPIQASREDELAKANYRRVFEMMQKYGKAARHVGIIRFLEARNEKYEQEDDLQFVEPRYAVHGEIDDVDIHYVIYKTETYRSDTGVYLEIVDTSKVSPKIQRAIYSLNDDAKRHHRVEASSPKKHTAYFAFPDDPIPREFVVSAQDHFVAPGTYARGSIMSSFKNGDIAFYTGQKIDYESSVIIVVLLAPFVGRFVSADRATSPALKGALARESYERALQAMQRYGKVAKHIGVIRLYHDRYTEDEVQDAEAREMAEILYAAYNKMKDVTDHYVPYSLVAYGSAIGHVSVATQSGSGIQKAIWAILESAHHADERK